MITNHSSDEGELGAFWRHVEYITAQFDGLCDGYKAAASPEWVTSLLEFLVLVEDDDDDYVRIGPTIVLWKILFISTVQLEKFLAKLPLAK